MEADTWEWKFLIEKTTACTNPCPTCVNNETLLQWRVGTADVNATIQFKNLTTPEAAVFKQTVAVPDVSKGDILDCDDVRAEGLLWKDREF